MKQSLPTTMSALGSAGRLVLRASVRRRLHVQKGDTLVLTEDDAGVRLQTLVDTVRQSQAYFRQFIPPGVSLVDEMLQGRRDEAARE